MRSFLKKLKIIIFILSFFTVAEVTIYLILDLLDVFNKVQGHYLTIIFGTLTPLLFVLLSIFLMYFFSIKESFKNLKIENKYYFGLDFDFYNGSIFSNQVYRIIRKRKKDDFYIISFTATSQDASINIVRNENIIKYNKMIAEMIISYFKVNRIYPHFDSSYCYDHNAFIIFLVGDEARINRIIKEFEENLYFIAKDNDLKVFVQPFFGVSSYKKGDDLSLALENANLARLESERKFELATFYDATLREEITSNDVQEIIDALKNEEFVVYYQPKFNVEQKKFISSEALIRWDSKKYGLLSPNKFIRKAEISGLIHDIDMFVFKKVCEDINEMRRKGRRVVPVSINFSLYEFYSPNFIEDIVEIIDQNNLPHNLIEIEITETTSQSNPLISISIMRQLKVVGLKVLMDDFGIGFSNFNNFRKMPIDAIKIDKSFIDDIVKDFKTKEIVKFLINMGKTSNLEVIAEGVDNQEQLDILKKAKIDTIQGFYYSRPLPKKEYEDFLASNQFEKKGDK